jgi:hypothetical protein
MTRDDIDMDESKSEVVIQMVQSVMTEICIESKFIVKYFRDEFMESLWIRRRQR